MVATTSSSKRYIVCNKWGIAFAAQAPFFFHQELPPIFVLMTDEPDIKPPESKQDKESIYELQKLDCNCNECKHLIRDVDKFKEAKSKIIDLARDLFESKRQRMIANAKSLTTRYPKKGQQALREAEKMIFTPPGFPSPIMYGTCAKFEKQITFLPGILQLNTQECFEHRKDKWDI